MATPPGGCTAGRGPPARPLHVTRVARPVPAIDTLLRWTTVPNDGDRRVPGHRRARPRGEGPHAEAGLVDLDDAVRRPHPHGRDLRPGRDRPAGGVPPLPRRGGRRPRLPHGRVQPARHRDPAGRGPPADRRPRPRAGPLHRGAEPPLPPPGPRGAGPPAGPRRRRPEAAPRPRRLPAEHRRAVPRLRPLRGARRARGLPLRHERLPRGHQPLRGPGAGRRRGPRLPRPHGGARPRRPRVVVRRRGLPGAGPAHRLAGDQRAAAAAAARVLRAPRLRAPGPPDGVRHRRARRAGDAGQRRGGAGPGAGPRHRGARAAPHSPGAVRSRSADGERGT